MHVGDFVLGDDPRTQRPEGVVRLALGPLAAALDLEEAFGDVVADGVAGDMVQCVGFGYVLCFCADDDGEFDFPVQLGRAARLLHVVSRTAQAVVGLDEDDRFYQ